MQHILNWSEKNLGKYFTNNFEKNNCHYGYLKINGKRREICDFIPNTNEQIILCAGFGDSGFKYSSIIGQEVLRLIESKKYHIFSYVLLY